MLSVVIPTYRREGVLIDTIDQLLSLRSPADEILIVDQTEHHSLATQDALLRHLQARRIRRICLTSPSIPSAMNRGLLEAQGEVVLFLDDDIRPDPMLIAAHRNAHRGDPRLLIAGRVLQPSQESVDFSGDSDFHFASVRSREIDHFMGGNFSLHRRAALAVGGFDENFVRAAYRFESEFAFRWRKFGGVILYEPDALIHHLKAAAGGTRSFGEHLTTVRPDHSVGEYYCVLRTWSGAQSIIRFVSRPMRAVATRFHLRNPWRIPVTLLAELRGLIWAMRLAIRGPRYVDAALLEDDRNV